MGQMLFLVIYNYQIISSTSNPMKWIPLLNPSYRSGNWSTTRSDISSSSLNPYSVEMLVPPPFPPRFLEFQRT